MKKQQLFICFLSFFCAFSALSYGQSRINEVKTKTLDKNQQPRLVVFKKGNNNALSKAPQILREQLKADNRYDFSLKTTQTDNLGFTHQKYQQHFNGVKIEFATYTAHAKNGQVQSISGEFYPIKELNTVPSLSKIQGLQRAINHLGAESYLWQDEGASKELGYSKPEGELVVLPMMDVDENSPSSERVKLAYKYEIFTIKPLGGGDVYVDAHNGRVLFYNAKVKHFDNFGHDGRTKADMTSSEVKKVFKTTISEDDFVSGTAQTRYSGTQTIETASSGGNYILSDASRSVYTRNANNQAPGSTSLPYINNYTQFTDNDNNWTASEHHNADKDDAALDAHWGAMMTYDYWMQEHGRDSYDDNGAQLRSYVHVDNDYDNAFWYANVMSYGDGSSNGDEGNGYFDALTSIDVAAHEIGHAVCEYTANLAYQRESGGMNEGFSDIWGAAVEHFAKGNGNDLNPDASIWLIGDEIDRRSGSPALRSMSDPTSLNQPDTYGGTYWQNPNCGTPTQNNDYCGVHTNSGVLNHWFYLLTVGGSGTNDVNDSYNVTGIGMTKAANISYRLESVYLSANSTYANARDYAIQATEDLYGADTQEVISVTNAWYAVGVGDEYVQTCSLNAPSSLASSNVDDNGFTVSWNSVSGAASYTVSVGGNTTMVSSTSYTASGLNSGTTYNVSVSANCSSGGSGMASSTQVTTTGEAPLEYCDSQGNNVNDEYISRVQLNTIDNASGGQNYSDFTAISTDLDKGESYTITVTPTWTGSTYNEGYSVWIDFNQDGDFTDSGEQVWTQSATQSTPVSGSFTVPSSALNGNTRMRVSMKYNGVPTSCEAFSYGEVEDYTVSIGEEETDTEAPTAPTNLSASNITETSVDLSWTASTDNVGVTGYEVFKDGSFETSVSGTGTSVSGLTSGTSYSFYVVAKDAEGNTSDVSNTVNVTTESGSTSYCSSQGNNVSDEYISNVQLNTINNDSGAQNYSDFTNLSTNLNKGGNYTVTVTPTWTGSTYNEAYSVWIDYNQDGDFTDSGEQVWTQSATNSSSVSGSFTVPTSALDGATRMRVSMKYNGIPTSCEAFSYGEVEDYTVIIGEGSGGGGSTTVTLSLTFDNYPEETSWAIMDGGTTVESGGTYGSQADGSTLNLSFDLPDGCYSLVANDAYGDGMCCSYDNGSYTLTDGGMTLASGGSFASSETTEFCVGGGSVVAGFAGTTTTDETGNHLKVFPNPVKQTLNVRLLGFEAQRYQVSNMMGQVVLKGNYAESIDVSKLNSGVYLLQLKIGEKTKVKRFIKE